MKRFAVGYEFLCRIVMMVVVANVAFLVHTLLGCSGRGRWRWSARGPQAGGQVLANLLAGGFGGAVLPVAPGRAAVGRC